MTLTQAAIWTKRAFFIFLVIIFLSLLSLVGYRLWQQYYIRTLPPVEQKPEMKFGDLPKIIFPASRVSSTNFSYSLDTVTGGFPELPKIMKVYYIPQPPVSLLSSEKAQKLAQSLGFAQGPEVLSQNKYRYADNINGELVIDITTGNFQFQRPIATDSAILNETLMPDQNQLVQDFKNYLSARSLLNDDLNTGTPKVVYSGISPEQSIKADVSLLPPSIDESPILTANFKTGLVQATITKSLEEKSKFLRVDYIYWPIDKSSFSTYPLKKAEEAFTNLKNGEGYVAVEPKSPNVSISSIYLAYFQQEEYTKYLQPIFVFEGPSFVAFVQAIPETLPTKVSVNPVN